MIPSLFAWLGGASAYRKVVAVLLAGSVAGFVLGQAAGHQPHRVAATVTNPARTASMIAGALGTPVVAPPHIVVPLSTRHGHQGDGGGKHGGDKHHADGNGHDVPHGMPFPMPGPGGDHHQDGAPMPPVPGTEDN